MSISSVIALSPEPIVIAVSPVNLMYFENGKKYLYNRFLDYYQPLETGYNLQVKNFGKEFIDNNIENTHFFIFV